MNSRFNFSTLNFAPVMDYPSDMSVLNLEDGIEPEKLASLQWAVGRYNEKRASMYTASQYRGDKIGELGSKRANGGWEPHLHFQLSWEDPGEADMPGVVSADHYEQALHTYPDPRLVLGKLY